MCLFYRGLGGSRFLSAHHALFCQCFPLFCCRSLPWFPVSRRSSSTIQIDCWTRLTPSSENLKIWRMPPCYSFLVNGRHLSPRVSTEVKWLARFIRSQVSEILVYPVSLSSRDFDFARQLFKISDASGFRQFSFFFFFFFSGLRLPR